MTRWALVLCLVTVGCSTAEKANGTSTPRGRPGESPTALDKAAAKIIAKADKPASGDQDFVSTKAEEVLKKEPEEKAPERDLSTEFLSAVGSPTQCLERRAQDQASGDITVSLVAHFTPNGMVTRGYAGGGGLAPSELECIKRRVEAVRLPGPIEGAPKSVMANLVFKLQKAEPKPTTN